MTSISKRNECFHPKIKTRGNTVQCYIRDDFLLSNLYKNSWFMTTKKEVVQMISASINEKDEIIIYGRRVQQKDFFFLKPIRSSYLHIYVAQASKMEQKEPFSIDDVFCKLVAVNYKESKTVFIPLHHTLPNK